MDPVHVRPARAAALLAIVALLGALSPAALAQPEGKRGFRELDRLLTPQFMRRDLPIIAEALELDRDQGTMIEALMLDYEAAFAAAVAAARADLAVIRPDLAMTDEERRARKDARKDLSRERHELKLRLRALHRAARQAGVPVDAELDASIRARREDLERQRDALRVPRPKSAEVRETAPALMERMEAWKAERRALGTEFLENLRVLLTSAQDERWTRFRRAFRRYKTLERGRFSGERVDLLLVLRRFDLLPALEGEAELIESYEATLDAALVARDRQLDAGATELFDGMAAGDDDRTAALQRKESDLRVHVRTVNKRFAELFGETVRRRAGSPAAEAFLRAWREAAYPRVYGSTRTRRGFEAALGLPDLDDDTRLAIEALHAQHEAALAAKRRTLVKILEEREPLRLEERMRRTAQRLSGADRERIERVETLEDQFEATLRERRKLGDRYRAQLDQLLTPTQIAFLPESRPARDARQSREKREKREKRAREKQAKREQAAREKAAKAAGRAAD